MLPRNHRIIRERDFALIGRSRPIASHGGFTMKAIPNQLGYPRFAVVISKKVYKKATDRNRLRRRLSPLLKHLSPQVGSRDFLITVRADLLPCPPEDLRHRITSLFSYNSQSLRPKKIS